MARKYQKVSELLPVIKELSAQGKTQEQIAKQFGLSSAKVVWNLLYREKQKEIQGGIKLVYWQSENGIMVLCGLDDDMSLEASVNSVGKEFSDGDIVIVSFNDDGTVEKTNLALELTERYKEILIDVVVPLITAILGFFGGCHFEKNKTKQKNRAFQRTCTYSFDW